MPRWQCYEATNPLDCMSACHSLCLGQGRVKRTAPAQRVSSAGTPGAPSICLLYTSPSPRDRG
eukprot:6176484-Amphidinium_carterae.1